MTRFDIKIIACLAMLIDHIGYCLPGTSTTDILFRSIGRIAFPIFAYQISEGILKTKNTKWYLGRLLILAIVSQVPYGLLFNEIGNAQRYGILEFISQFLYSLVFPTKLNILFGFVNSILAIKIYERFKHKKIVALDIGIFFAFMSFTQTMKIEYGFYSVLIVSIFYIFKDSPKYITIFYSLGTLLYSYLIHWWTQLLCIFALPLIFAKLTYKHESKFQKYLFYIFYPLHITILYIIFKK